ncbi:MAG TPA: DUF4923 family protein [Candidatus Avibacteroides excrementipullorum]|jgi:arginine repressor|nr:DUF4923 family protein [Candidatus Avibacteroides excrementipullorum]
MKHFTKFLVLSVCFAVMGVMTANAQGLKDLLGGKLGDAVGDIVGGLTKQGIDVTGTWVMSGSSCQFESDNLLKKAGGAVMADKLSDELDKLLEKIGIDKGDFSYTFNSDSTFTSKSKLGNKKGSYSVNAEESTLTLKYIGGLMKSTCTVKTSADEIQMLYDADKLKELITNIAGKSNINALELLGSLMEQYDGCMLGFKFSRQ